jgi:hypothetical protein
MLAPCARCFPGGWRRSRPRCPAPPWPALRCWCCLLPLRHPRIAIANPRVAVRVRRAYHGLPQPPAPTPRPCRAWLHATTPPAAPLSTASQSNRTAGRGRDQRQVRQPRRRRRHGQDRGQGGVRLGVRKRHPHPAPTPTRPQAKRPRPLATIPPLTMPPRRNWRRHRGQIPQRHPANRPERTFGRTRKSLRACAPA